MIKKVLEILSIKYGHTRIEKIEDFLEEQTKFKGEEYDDDGELLLGMKEINQKKDEQKMNWSSPGCLVLLRKGRSLINLVERM